MAFPFITGTPLRGKGEVQASLPLFKEEGSQGLDLVLETKKVLPREGPSTKRSGAVGLIAKTSLDPWLLTFRLEHISHPSV